jgi:hypothetical protein
VNVIGPSSCRRIAVDAPRWISANVYAAFGKGLSETGFVEGRNVTIEYRFANNVKDRLPELAADLVRRKRSQTA